MVITLFLKIGNVWEIICNHYALPSIWHTDTIKLVDAERVLLSGNVCYWCPSVTGKPPEFTRQTRNLTNTMNVITANACWNAILIDTACHTEQLFLCVCDPKLTETILLIIVMGPQEPALSVV